MPKWCNAPDDLPGGGLHVIGRCSGDFCDADAPGEGGGVDAVRARREDQDGVAVRHEDQRVRNSSYFTAEVFSGSGGSGGGFFDLPHCDVNASLVQRALDLGDLGVKCFHEVTLAPMLWLGQEAPGNGKSPQRAQEAQKDHRKSPHSGQGVAQYSGAMPNPGAAELVELAKEAGQRCGSTIVVLIDGPAGAGKTTLGRRLAAALDAQLLHADDMYEGWDGLQVLKDVLVVQVLEPLSQGIDAGFRRWDWVANARAETVAVPVSPAIVIEGVGVAQRQARPYASLVLYVEAPWERRLERGIVRDGEAMRPHWEAWQLAEAAFLKAEGTREAADFIIDGTRPVPD